MKPIAVKINPHRVCAAIAKIGYEPHSALMDIIDNSVAAHARRVTVKVRIRDGMLPTNKKNVEAFTIMIQVRRQIVGYPFNRGRSECNRKALDMAELGPIMTDLPYCSWRKL